MKITLNKQLANVLLQNNSVESRKLDLSKISRYTHQMNSGKWLKSSDSHIRVEYTKLTNGQHRLIAFIQSSLKTLDFEMTVIRRCDECGVDMINTKDNVCKSCTLIQNH